MQNSSRWPLCPTFRYGVKGQKIWIISNNVKLQIVQGQRFNINNGCVPVISDDSSLVLSFFFILPAQPQDLVSYSLACRRSRSGFCFLIVSYTGAFTCACILFFYGSLLCRRTGRVLYLTRFFLLILPAQPQDTVFFSLSCRRSRRILFSSRFFFLSFFFLLLSSFWQHVFFTYFPTSDFNQTWSKWPVPWPLLRHRQWWGQRSRWGHWGQKGHFHQKGIKSYRILSIDTGLMHMQ